MATTSFIPRPKASQFRPEIAIVASRYNDEFVAGLVAAAQGELAEVLPEATVSVFRVPGAFEIPVCAQHLAKNTNVDVIIALGVIIHGETDHADLIARAACDSLQRVALDNLVPVINEVLLLKSSEQARERCLGSEINRGVEAARAAAGMIELFQELRKTSAIAHG